MCFSRNIYDLGCNKNPALASSVVLFLTSVTTNDKLIFRKKSSLLYMEIKVGVGGGGKKENKESPNPSSSDKGLVFLLSSCFSLIFFFKFQSVAQNYLQQNHLEVKLHLWGWNPEIFMNFPADFKAY